MEIAPASSAPIVAAVAGVGHAPQPRAVEWAACEAAARGLPLRLVHGITVLPYQTGPAEQDLQRGIATAELEDAIALSRRAHPGLPVSGGLMPQRPDLALQEESAAASLVVIGTKSHAAAPTEDRYGSVAGVLLAQACCPVIAVPAGGRQVGDPDAVVVAVDGSPVSHPAVAFAFDAASRRGAPLVVVHCWPVGRTTAARVAALAEHRVLLAGTVAGFVDRYPDVALIDAGSEGDPAAELVHRSRRAALIVVGTHGRDRWATAVWGSVSRTLVRESACPVAVVRPATATATGIGAGTGADPAAAPGAGARFDS